MFRIIVTLVILIICYLFYSKLSSYYECFSYTEDDHTYYDMDDDFNPSAFASKAEMLQYLHEYFINGSNMVFFNKNGKQCAFMKSPVIEKDVVRYVVPKKYTKVNDIEYENVNNSIYKNDRHVDEDDKNMHTVLNFTYEKNKDEIMNQEDQETLAHGGSSMLYNYESIPYYNSQKVPSEYVETYKICEKTASYDKNEIESLTTGDGDMDFHFQSTFPCASLYCAESDIDQQVLRKKVFDNLKDEVVEENKNKIYDILYSSNFLNWILNLKKSNDALHTNNTI